MHNSIDWTLVGKIVANEATDAERQQFDDWLSAHPEQKPLLDNLRRFWLTADAKLPNDPLDMARAFERLQQRIENEKVDESPAGSRWRVRRWVGWAAAASVAIAVGVWSWLQIQTPAPQAAALVEQINQKGTRSQIRLADGSVVWLNADSHLRFPKAFTGNLREVTLEGEAFFKVTPNPKQPFVVRLATGSVRVLGTSFNIRAYPGDTTVETSVVTGRVAFIAKPAATEQKTGSKSATTQKDTLLLTPNTKAIQSLTRHSVATEPTVAVNQIAWTESKLVFRNTPMGEVAKTLERWYGTPVTLERESLRHCPLTGTFQNQSLREVMNLIAMTNRFQYELTPSQVTIKGPGCDGQ
ncbi:FecR family protein [Larkinella sp. GY13]|uniref:FecR family protein n=1 Tax=Larkinella sp. GY13 TaxID=3453720 RepID=UPI003EED80AF